MAKLASKKGTRRLHARRKGRHKKKTNMKLMSYIYTIKHTMNKTEMPC